MNSVNITGNLGKDPKTNYLESGKVVTSFSVATKYLKDTVWMDVQCWDKAAELAGEYLKSGSKVGISGKLKEEKWTTQDGTERKKLVIVANDITFLDKKES